ncbi:MAG: class I SAM-dependent methyltransferase [Verrucomicrobiota bacterium]
MSALGDRLRLKRALRRLPLALRHRVIAGLPRGILGQDFLLDRLPPGSIGAEIGVHEGDFSRRILQLIQPRRLHLVDPWAYEDASEYRHSLYGGKRGGDQLRLDQRYAGVVASFQEEIARGQVQLHRQSSEAASATFADDYFDWVYLDGNHTYACVFSDLTRYCPKVRRGGLIAGDDYGVNGWWNGGVTRAVDEFAAGGLVELVEIRRRQFILRRR